MLRTSVARNGLLRITVKQVIKGNTVRTFSVECAKRKLYSAYSLVQRINSPKLLKHKEWLYQIRHYADYPKHIKVTLPALSPTMDMGTIVSWAKKEGDKLNEGDSLAEIETDKATMGFETPEEGYLAKILIPAGTKEVPIGKLVCIIVDNEADVAAFKDFKDDGAAAAPPKPAAPPSAPAGAPAPPAQPSGPPPPAAAPSGGPQVPPPPADAGARVYVSPMAKRLAEQRNIRLQGKGSGLFGSFTVSDVEKFQGGAPAPGAPRASSPAPSAPPKPTAAPGASYVDIPVSNIRSVIAKRLLESKTTIPHYYLTIDCNVDKLMATRARFNKRLEKQKLKISVNDFVIKACAMACKKVPDANSAWFGTVIRQYKNVDISVAVSTDKGLITPIVFEADHKGLVDISKDVKELAGKARAGKLQPHEFQGGTFSVSNLGMFGVNNFCAVINPPQSCILAIGTLTKRFVEDSSEKGFKVASYMTVTLSCDHRVVDGAVGAQWLQAFRDFMEDPESMIL